MKGFVDRIVARALQTVPVVHRRREPIFIAQLRARNSAADDDRVARRSIEESNRRAKPRHQIGDPLTEAPTIESSSSLGFVPTPLPSLRRDDLRRTTPQRGAERGLDADDNDGVGDGRIASAKPIANSWDSHHQVASAPAEMPEAASRAPHALKAAPVAHTPLAESDIRPDANALADAAPLSAPVSRSGDGRHVKNAVQSDVEAGTHEPAAQSGSMVRVEGRLAADERPRGESSFEPQGAHDRATAREGDVEGRPAEVRREGDDTVVNDPTIAGFDRATAHDDSFTINVSIGRIDVAPPAFPSTPAQIVRAESSRASLDDYMHERAKIRGR